MTWSTLSMCAECVGDMVYFVQCPYVQSMWVTWSTLSICAEYVGDMVYFVHIFRVFGYPLSVVRFQRFKLLR